MKGIIHQYIIEDDNISSSNFNQSKIFYKKFKDPAIDEVVKNNTLNELIELKEELKNIIQI